MKTLVVDIETSPNHAHVWGLFKQTVSLSQLRESTKVICFAAKWTDSKSVMFHSTHHNGHEDMVLSAHALLDEADVVVHYNGTSFDIPHLQREFVTAGLSPPSPFRQVDLMRVVKRQFRFASNKLDHITRELGLAGKASHSGHDLWVRCMAGDPKAWAVMRRYNKQDVVLTEQLYQLLLPWIQGHPHRGLYGGDADACPTCGSANLQRRGQAVTAVTVFQQYQCQDCGKWSRGKRAIGSVETRSA